MAHTDADAAARTVWVGNLLGVPCADSRDALREAVSGAFSCFGRVRHVSVCVEPGRNKPKGYAFVQVRAPRGRGGLGARGRRDSSAGATASPSLSLTPPPPPSSSRPPPPRPRWRRARRGCTWSGLC